MHVPTFIVYFLAVGVPLTLIAVRFVGTDARGNLGTTLFAAILAASISVAAWMSWGAEPTEADCRPAGAAIYNDC